MERWIGNVALVTGATSGIGYAIALDLAKHGMKVAAIGRNMDKIKELEKECYKDGFITGIKCDVTKADEVKAAIKWIETNLGEINVLVNSAGIFIRESLTRGIGEGISNMFETNVIGLSTCTREVIAVMKRHNVKQGHIINIGSICGHRIANTPDIGAYSASKHAVRVLTNILRTELMQEKIPVRVSCISPGLVATNMTKGVLHLDLPIIQPSDISNCVIFALSTPPNVNISQMIVQPRDEQVNGEIGYPAFNFKEAVD